MAKAKVKFEVLENETIDECVNRIKKQGYSPIRRIERPIFQETEKDGQKTYEPVGREIIFEAIQMD